MMFNCKSLPLAFLVNALSPFLVFAADPALGIRGFAMGDRYAAVQKQEAEWGELSPKPSSSGRLVYEGSLLGEKAELTYSFRGQRLASVRYLWRIPSQRILFLQDLHALMQRKYRLAQSNTLSTPQGDVSYFLYGGAEDLPSLLAELEVFPPEGSLRTILLEFRAPDPDSVLVKRILNEDI